MDNDYIVGRAPLKMGANDWRNPGEPIPEVDAWAEHVKARHLSAGAIFDTLNPHHEAAQELQAIAMTANVLGIDLSDIPDTVDERRWALAAIRQVAMEREMAGHPREGRVISPLSMVSGRQKALQWGELVPA